jgi:hypothetical protein
LSTKLNRYRVEIKYCVITAVILAGLAALAALSVFDGLESVVNRAMDNLVDWGLIGMFLIGLPSNMTLILIIPYNMPMFTLVIYANSIWEVIALGIATGLGAGIGEATSYAVAHTIVNHVEDLEKSALFRWTKRTIERKPVLIPFFVWLASATPVPDAAIIVPMAMVKYPWQKMLVPMITGKVFQNVVVALIFRYATRSASHLASRNINFDMTAILVVLFVMVILYQIEKARAELRRNRQSPARDTDPAVINN